MPFGVDGRRNVKTTGSAVSLLGMQTLEMISSESAHSQIRSLLSLRWSQHLHLAVCNGSLGSCRQLRCMGALTVLHAGVCSVYSIQATPRYGSAHRQPAASQSGTIQVEVVEVLDLVV